MKRYQTFALNLDAVVSQALDLWHCCISQYFPFNHSHIVNKPHCDFFFFHFVPLVSSCPLLLGFRISPEEGFFSLKRSHFFYYSETVFIKEKSNEANLSHYTLESVKLVLAAGTCAHAATWAWARSKTDVGDKTWLTRPVVVEVGATCRPVMFFHTEFVKTFSV